MEECEHIWDHYIGKESLKYLLQCLLCKELLTKNEIKFRLQNVTLKEK